MLVSELLDKYQTEVVPKHSPRTQKDYAWHLQRLKKVFGDIEVKALKPRDVGMFLDHPTGKISRNRSIAVLSAAYSKAVGRWWLAEVNPCLKVERNDSKPRTRYVTTEEYEAVRAIMPDRLQIAMDLALLTGQRQGDLLRLTWNDLTKERDGLFFEQGKTGKKLIVNVSDRVKEVMMRSRRIPSKYPPIYLIRTKEGAPFTSEGFRANWQRYMRKVMKLGILKTRHTFHDLRAKNVSDEKNIETAMHRAGHSNMNMTTRVYDRNVRRVPALM